MSFPQTPLDVLVEVALDADRTADPATWAFDDATSLVFDRDEDQIDIVRGRPDQAGTADASTLSMTGDNREGHWATKNPLSPWYGRLRKGTPVRVSAEGHIRYTGFFSELPPRWDVSGALRWVPLKAKGLLYQLGLEGAPQRSALRRTVEHAGPDRLWPLEDGPTAVAGASAFPGGVPTGDLQGDALFTSTTIGFGAAGGVDTAGGSFEASTGESIVAAPGGWTFEFVCGWDVLPTIPNGEARAVAFAQSTGAAGQMGVGIYNDSGAMKWIHFIANNGSGSLDLPGPNDPVIEEGRPYHLRVTGTQVGAGVRVTKYVDGVAGSPSGFNETLMMPDRVVVNGSAAPIAPPADPQFFTSLAWWASAGISAVTWPAADGYDGELAHERILRLGDEEQVSITCSATESIAMGPQKPEAFLPLLRECEATDQGYLREGLNWDLVYQSHTERQNQPAALELDYTTPGHVSPPLEPTDDDQDARNDVSVIRRDGSSGRAEADPDSEFAQTRIGLRKDEKTYSLADDTWPVHLAGWRLHMLTWPGYRWPVVTVNLAAAPGLIADLCAADLAFRLTIANPPNDAGASTIDLIADGSSETIKQYDWLWQGNCVANGPWRVGILGNSTSGTTPGVGRDTWDSCVLAEDLTTTETAVDVTTTPLITTTAAEFPFGIVIGGERMTATACSGASNPQTLTVVRSVNTVSKAHTAGAVVALVDVLILTL